jgi:hypothetical protein
VQAKLELFSTHDEEGMTPLMVAAKYGHVYVCADLIRHKVRRSWCSYRLTNQLFRACCVFTFFFFFFSVLT